MNLQEKLSLLIEEEFKSLNYQIKVLKEEITYLKQTNQAVKEELLDSLNFSLNALTKEEKINLCK